MINEESIHIIFIFVWILCMNNIVIFITDDPLIRKCTVLSHSCSIKKKKDKTFGQLLEVAAEPTTTQRETHKQCVSS